MACVHVADGLVEDKVLAVFVYCVICQMHKHIVQVLRTWCLVLISGKSSKSLFKHKYSQWINSCDQDINPQIKLKSINQIGFMQIPLHYTFIIFEFIDIPCEIDASALTACFWFDYESLSFSLLSTIMVSL